MRGLCVIFAQSGFCSRAVPDHPQPVAFESGHEGMRLLAVKVAGRAGCNKLVKLLSHRSRRRVSCTKTARSTMAASAYSL